MCSAPYTVRVIIPMRMRWTEHVARMGKKKRFMYDFGGETRRKENTRRRMEDNIKIDVKCRGANIFQRCRIHLKSIGAGRVTWTKFNTEDSNVRCYSTQFSGPGDLTPGFCAPLS